MYGHGIQETMRLIIRILMAVILILIVALSFSITSCSQEYQMSDEQAQVIHNELMNEAMEIYQEQQATKFLKKLRIENRTITDKRGNEYELSEILIMYKNETE